MFQLTVSVQHTRNHLRRFLRIGKARTLGLGPSNNANLAMRLSLDRYANRRYTWLFFLVNIRHMDEEILGVPCLIYPQSA
jgi:hypothetical protein